MGILTVFMLFFTILLQKCFILFPEMSRAMKRKHVLRENLKDDYSVPTADQQIVKILKNTGNNLHAVQSPDGTTFLVSMPTKFRGNIYVRRGTFVLIEPIKEGVKVKGEIVRILTSEHIKYFKQDNVWPKEFSSDDQQNLNDCEDDIYVNKNRQHIVCSDSEEESDEDSDDTDSSEGQEYSLDDNGPDENKTL